MNPVIINLATGHHVKGQHRLQRSIQQFSPKIPFLSWNSESQIKAPLHKSNPYAFKVYAFYAAIAAGYDLIFWMDASCYLIKPIEPLFEIIEKEGYFMHEAGHYVGKWTNDHAWNYFGIEREELDKLPMFTAGCFGLNMNDASSLRFLNEWRLSMEAGCFRGEYRNHRHDMTAGSIIAKTLGMQYKFGQHYLAYAAPECPVNDTVIIKLQGIA